MAVRIDGPTYRYNANWELQEVSLVSWDARISAAGMNAKLAPGWRIEEDDYRSAGPAYRTGRLIRSDRADTNP